MQCMIADTVLNLRFKTSLFLTWNRKRQYAGSKTASDRKQKTLAVPLL